MPVIVEIKSRYDGDMRLADRGMAAVTAYAGPVCLKSFDPAVLVHLRGAGAQCPLGLVAQAHYDASEEWAGLPQDRRASFQDLRDFPLARPDFLSWYLADLPHAVPMLCREWNWNACDDLDGALAGGSRAWKTLGGSDYFRRFRALNAAHKRCSQAGKQSFAVKALVDEKLESPDIGPVVVAAELGIGVRNVFAGREISDIKIDRRDQGRNLMHNREDRQLGTSVARNIAPTFVAIVTRFGRRNSRGEAGKIDAAVAASVLHKLG